MSVVIVGGHDRMVSQYVKICKSFNCKAKVFTQMTADFGKQIGAPDLLVLFTSTVSHKMIRTAVDGAKGSRTAATPAAKPRWKKFCRNTVQLADVFKCEATANSVTGHVCVNSNSVGFWKR